MTPGPKREADQLFRAVFGRLIHSVLATADPNQDNHWIIQLWKDQRISRVIQR